VHNNTTFLTRKYNGRIFSIEMMNPSQKRNERRKIQRKVEEYFGSELQEPSIEENHQNIVSQSNTDTDTDIEMKSASVTESEYESNFETDFETEHSDVDRFSCDETESLHEQMASWAIKHKMSRESLN